LGDSSVNFLMLDWYNGKELANSRKLPLKVYSSVKFQFLLL